MQLGRFPYGRPSGKTYEGDVIVLGSGIAGLFFCLSLPAHFRIHLVTKKKLAEANTNYAQGGIAAVMNPEDTFADHIQDTLVAGAGLCHRDAVRILVEEGPERIRDLIAIGMEFTQADGRLALAREGGHSRARIVHARDFTGRVVEESLIRALAARKNVTIWEDHQAIDLITSQKLGLAGPAQVKGAYVYDQNSGAISVFAAPVVFLATGGAGRIYQFTTNPAIATGDGVAMAYRAGCRVANLEFYQFHPTALWSSRREDRRFLISEAVRGHGAVLRDPAGHAFMADYHAQRDLAPRDVVAQAIDSEMKKWGVPHVHLDLTAMPPNEIEEQFPLIYKTCLERYGLDIRRQMIPVVPAAHYMCGGVVTDMRGRTDLAGLYASGEVTHTGVHGANRLASNSLLEGLVFSKRAALDIEREFNTLKSDPIDRGIPAWYNTGSEEERDGLLINHNLKEVGELMQQYVGIVRSDKHLELALKRLQTIGVEVDELYVRNAVDGYLLDLRNLTLVATLVTRSALMRKESRGLQCSVDHPRQSEEPPQDTILADSRFRGRPGAAERLVLHDD